jgi:hypothetical protein
VDLKEGKSPVIIGAPPPPDVRQKCGRRMFVDGKVDYEGPARVAPSKRPTDKNPPDDISDDSRINAQSSNVVPKSHLEKVILQQSVKKSQSVINKEEEEEEGDDDDDGDDDISIVKSSECDKPHPGVKRKPEQRDSGGAKKKVHIIISDDSDGSEDEVSDGDGKAPGRAQTKRKGRQGQKAVKTIVKGTQKGLASTVQRNIVGGQPMVSGSSQPSSEQAHNHPFIGEYYALCGEHKLNGSL